MRQLDRLASPVLAGWLLAAPVAAGAALVAAPVAVQAQQSSAKKTTKPAAKKPPAKKPAAKPAAKSAQKPAAKPVQKTAAKPDTAKPAPPPPPALETYKVLQSAQLLAAPAAGAVAQLGAGTTVNVVGRERGWVKVQAEGWVRESEIAPADTAVKSSIGAIDLRREPEKWRGSTVQWTVEYLALQKADTLRKGLNPGEQYMLARGPGDEAALLYVVLTPEALGTVRALSPLSKVTIVARVRNARSEPAGVPVLDIRSLQPLK